MRQRLPSDDYLLAYLREAMRLYQEALPTASPLQRWVWQWCSRDKFIEGAWPFYEGDIKVTCVISNAMLNAIDSGGTMPLEEALARAKRWVSKNYQPPSPRYQRLLDERYKQFLKSQR